MSYEERISDVIDEVEDLLFDLELLIEEYGPDHAGPGAGRNNGAKAISDKLTEAMGPLTSAYNAAGQANL